MQYTMPLRTRAGFTAIELMMVIAIMILVSTMAVPAAFSSMRYATFSKAKSDILALHNEARSATMLGTGTQNMGVRWQFESGRWVGTILNGSVSVAGTERSLPGSLLFMSNGSTISDSIEWWYERGSGRLVNSYQGAAAANDSVHLAMVGMPMPELYMAQAPAMIKQQDEATDPGLELTTRQSDLRAAIRIYPTGLMTMTHLDAVED